MFGIKKQINTEIGKIRKELNEDLNRGSEIMTSHSKELSKLVKFVECLVCGCMVNKEKANEKWHLEDKEYSLADLYFLGFGKKEEKEAKKTYICVHCQPKKTNKKKK